MASASLRRGVSHQRATASPYPASVVNTSAHRHPPDRTLYSAIAREILKKGKEWRFKKVEKEKFALRGEG